MTIWIGRVGWVSSALSRSGSRSIKVSRLYDGTRRANPKVITFGSSTPSTQSDDNPRLAQLSVSRRRAMLIRSRRIRCLSDQMVPASTSYRPAQS